MKHDSDWTPSPPSDNPLGPPDDHCTGGVTVGSWAHFTFPAIALPANASVLGITVRFKYPSPSGATACS